MAVKIRTTQEKSEKFFLNEMTDKTYGEAERVERITISLDGKLYDKIEDIVRKRRKTKENNRTISAFMREALEFYLNKKS